MGERRWNKAVSAPRTQRTVTPQEEIPPVASSVVRFPVLFALWLVASTASGQEPAHPLKPPDRSSPRAALKTFLGSFIHHRAHQINPSRREERVMLVGKMRGSPPPHDEPIKERKHSLEC